MSARSLKSTVALRVLVVTLAGLAAGLVGIAPSAAQAQTPTFQEPDAQGKSPEELVDEAIQKVKDGSAKEALELVYRAKAIKPNLDKIELAEGLIYVAYRQYPQAISALEEYNKSDAGRNDYRGFAAVGKIYHDSGTYRQALRPLEQARTLAPAEEDGKPVRARLTMDLASAQSGLRRFKDALATAKEAEQMAPKDADVQFGLARIALGTDDKATAEAAANRAITLSQANAQKDPFDKDAYGTLRSAYQLLIRLRGLELQVNSEDASLYFAIADLSRKAADVELRGSKLVAREYALQACAKDPKRNDWQVFLAQVETELGGYQEAKDRLEELLVKDPTNKEAAKLMEHVREQLAKPSSGG